jgi:hypothetical protein
MNRLENLTAESSYGQAMKNSRAFRKAQEQFEALASLALVVFCGIGVYQTAVFYFPGIDSGLLTCLILFTPAGLLKLTWNLGVRLSADG